MADAATRESTTTLDTIAGMVAVPWTTTLETAESCLAQAGAWVGEQFEQRPALAAAMGGSIGVGLAVLIGPGELFVGLALAYAAYRMAASHERPLAALEEALALEAGTLGDRGGVRSGA